MLGLLLFQDFSVLRVSLLPISHASLQKPDVRLLCWIRRHGSEDLLMFVSSQFVDQFLQESLSLRTEIRQQ
jgi:hypothetical protein